MKLSVGQLRALVREATKPNAGQFDVGDGVNFGKYKNKKGKIKRVFKDDKDHVAVEIEPDPKGRKKNVEMGLYKIWPRDEKPEDE